ncbi:MAG: hypothetical protein SOX56_03140 [[Pasteurella] mairii]|uniref:Lipoprotein n=1 Tax=[Pasteurella] mairii TaxID=757 RepID=A0A379B5R8_9PAST|nr:hypothetical protein [[Pasteurella] mairii]SUB33953.1 Uncharacterised protein [[Pasteurella] mairii]
MSNNQVIKLGILSSIVSFFLAGCGVVGNAVISDQSLKEKAAFALNTTADKVTISQRNGGVDDIRFVATVGQRSHQCYITTIGGVLSSDALCSGGGKTIENSKASSCNPLMKAAGRC